MLPLRFVMAIAAVVDVALHARGEPVGAKALAARLALGPRHLEPLLQSLVRSGILKGMRGPRGGYELARERRRISAGDIVRAVEGEAGTVAARRAGLVSAVIEPAITEAVAALMQALDDVTVEHLCRRAEATQITAVAPLPGEFHI